MSDKKELKGLELMRKPFEPHLISKLPKQAKWMTEAKQEYANCNVCGGYHHPKAVHLDYVGHAALTDRLLDCDPNWSWDPVSFDQNGSPFLDKNGGLWIRLTVCGVTRLGYGHPDGKNGGDAVKEAIGDALRNAAMRFGAALDLWHKGDLHPLEEPNKTEKKNDNSEEKKAKEIKSWIAGICHEIKSCPEVIDVNNVIHKYGKDIEEKCSDEQKKFINDQAAKRLAFLSQAPVTNGANHATA